MDYNSKNYRDLVKGTKKRLGKWFKQRFDIAKKWSIGKVLEVGCGEHPIFQDSVKIDVAKIDGCIQWDCNKGLPVNVGKFDTIIGLEFIEHLTEFDNFLKACYSHLNKNGRTIFSTPNILSVKNRINFLLGKPKPFIRHGGEHFLFFTHTSLKHKLEEHSFKVIFMRPLGRIISINFCNGFIIVAEKN